MLAALRERGPLSRAEIARHTGISGPTVTRAVAGLLEAQFVEEGDARQPSVGRPGRVLRLASEGVAVLGVVVGARRCEAVSAGLDGSLRGSARSLETPARYADLVNGVARLARALLAERGVPALGLGLSVPGLLERRDGRTVVSPNLHQTDGHRLGADLAERLGLETAVVQESHGLCLAEQAYGAARGVADFAMLDVSEGMGLGVVEAGRILSGHRGLAGELGHVTIELNGRPCGCGNRGCLETVATDTALATAVSERLGRCLTFEDVLSLVRAGELDAGPEVGRVLEHLAVGVAAVVNVFNPSKVFVYGRLFDLGEGLFERLLGLTRERALGPSLADCAVIRARGNKQLGAVAGIIRHLTAGREGAVA